jgi:nucleotide-binding universal stress UspA family protein
MSILLAYIPKPQSDAAVRFAIREAAAHGLPLVVLNTSRGDALADPHLATTDQFDRIGDLARDAGVEVRVEQPIRNESPAEEILQAAREHDATMIVLATRRRSPVGKLVMGSTAQRVILEAEPPVVAVKPSSA